MMTMMFRMYITTGTNKSRNRGCNGFDGDFEALIAIRRPCLRYQNGNLNINAKPNKFAFAAA